MVRAFSRTLRRFGLERGASTTTVVAIALPILFVTAGGSVDYARMSRLQEIAQNAADVSVVHLAKYVTVHKKGEVPPKERDRIASRIFESQLGPGIETRFEVVTEREKKQRLTTLTATSRMPTSFLRVVGIDTLDFQVTSRAQFEEENFAVEVAFVVNTSASMSTARKTQALADAFAAVMAKFKEINTVSPNRARVSVVPFQLGVSVDNPGSSHFHWTGASLVPPSGCVFDRPPPLAYSKWGTRPPDLPPPPDYPPPDGGGGGGLIVVGGGDGSGGLSGGSMEVRYPLADAMTADGICDSSTIIPLTTNLDAVTADLPVPGWIGGTNGAVGLVWGWNMLTPGAPSSKSGTIPLEPDQKSLQRVIIYMTDGENTGNVLGKSASVVDDWSLQLCSGIKADKITVITINIDGEGSESFLKACASSPERYKKVPAPDLPKILEDLAEVVTGYTPIRLVN